MQIKELELSGFKSFVDRVKLNFRPGITAIVGPNGCGKSNIIDAIRWIMGEHNARQLRGTKMEDLIFNGSETRKPTGMAEVSLVLSNGNANGKGNGNGNGNGNSTSALGQATELMITRRLFRSGESEYYINKVPCRLRDVVEVFLDSGVGTKSYSIMEQGKVDFILSLKPEERRILIEEAAGISKYRTRKKEALSRMESTRNNLARLKDIIAELQVQMRGLDLQVKRLKRYRVLKEEIRELDLQLAARRCAELQATAQRLQQELTICQDRSLHLETQLRSCEALLEEDRLHQVQLQKSIAEAQQRYYQSKEALQKEENNISLYVHDLQTAETQIGKITHDLELLEDDISHLGADITQYQEHARTAAQVITDIESKASLSSASVAASKEALTTLRSHIENAHQELRRISFQKTEAHNAVLLNERLIEEVRLKAQKLEAEHAASQQRSANLAAEQALREKKVHELVAKREQYEKDLSSLTQRRDRASVHVKDAEARVADLKERCGSIRARYQSLKELQDSYEGFADGVKYLMHEAAENADLSQAIACLFTDILETDPSYERALEAYLDKKLQTFIVTSWEQGLSMLQMLRTTPCGKISWVTGAATPSGYTQEAVPEGAVPLSSLVRVPEPYRNLIAQVLQRVYLVQTLDHALCLRNQGYVTSCFVTPQGDLLDATGIVTGGGDTGTASVSLLARSRELRGLAADITRLEQELQTAEHEKDNAAAELQRLSDALATLAAEKQQLDIAIVQESAALEQTAKELLIEQKKTATITDEIHEATLLTQRYAAERDDGVRKIQTLSDAEASLNTQINELRQQESSLLHELETVESAATELRIALAAARTTYENTCANLKRIQEQHAVCCAKKDTLLHERDRQQETVARLTTALTQAREAMDQLSLQTQANEQSLNTLHEQLAACTEQIQAHEEKCKQYRAEQQESEPQKYEIQRELSTITVHLEHLAKELQEKYSLSMDNLPSVDAGADFNEADIRQRLEQLQKRLDNIGEVNPGAAREYEELEKRYSYLCQQEQDLLQAIESLHKVITKINRVTRQKFMEAFTAINKNFQELFPILFNGGKAYLQLTNENDLFETGVDIFAQPPGKKLQSLDLLSGGERALTVIAILFSIFLTKPTPFCLMDEIDAPLDDTNIGRFLSHLQNMAKQSQFIIVTHNKLSMQAADSLYGVTMEERGVSKVVSVSLN